LEWFFGLGLGLVATGLPKHEKSKIDHKMSSQICEPQWFRVFRQENFLFVFWGAFLI
jgi:hypothetical protein